MLAVINIHPVETNKIVWMCSHHIFSECSRMCVCVYMCVGRGRAFGEGGLAHVQQCSLIILLQQETGTETVRSQGTIGGKVTIAQASSSLVRVSGVTGSALLPRCVYKLPKTTVEQTEPRHKSIWSAHGHTHWQEAGPAYSPTPHLLTFSSLNSPLVSSILWGLCFVFWLFLCNTADHTVLNQLKTLTSVFCAQWAGTCVRPSGWNVRFEQALWTTCKMCLNPSQ